MVQRAILETRAAVRRALEQWLADPGAARREAPASPLVLVALSGGADSLALAAATAYEAPRSGLRAGAVVVDHGLQSGSETVAARAAEQAAGLGLDPVLVERVAVSGEGGDGPEAAARSARYAVFARSAERTGAAAILTAHTRDDQAEQVLLALVRGSGSRSLSGIPARRALDAGGSEGAVILRPFLGEQPAVTRAVTEEACAELGIEPWRDPHNDDDAYTRVRVRRSVLPALERELGPGIAGALARTADLAREDADALDALAEETLEEIVEHAEAGISVSISALAANLPALRHRIIRLVARAEFGAQLSREHTRAVARLVTDWRGQGPVDVPGASVRREAGRLVFRAR
ncbi:tRNA lysidine(34) synthetase TilS [Leucobacter tenebrionis]|uniref:tRNA lysidine(34) synthetase TilS n=1 Tax=Leucobacter tenebrionis TaxID=2873270 RepID=UPI001CA75ACF|nr:tRNA lysidine(34) synthetase TilS [Leucobacter tenebrionis]QZY51427.1 tRNA lysidine(34) synthetase TilS [Leucobacter tenebrionis]